MYIHKTELNNVIFLLFPSSNEHVCMCMVKDSMIHWMVERERPLDIPAIIDGVCGYRQVYLESLHFV